MHASIDEILALAGQPLPEERSYVSCRSYRVGPHGQPLFDDEITQGGTIFLPYAHAPSYHASDKVELVAGADPHPEQRALFGARWGHQREHLYADYRTMLAQERLDIVSS